MIATLTSKGQITLPVEIRRYLKLQSGDKLDFINCGDGRIEGMVVKSSLKSLKGILPPPKMRVTLEDMKKAIAKGASRDRD